MRMPSTLPGPCKQNWTLPENNAAAAKHKTQALWFVREQHIPANNQTNTAACINIYRRHHTLSGLPDGHTEPAAAAAASCHYSHSMVLGGLLVMSYTTRLTLRTCRDAPTASKQFVSVPNHLCCHVALSPHRFRLSVP